MLIPCLVNFLMQTHFSRLVLSKLCVTYENRIIFILIQDIYIDSLSFYFFLLLYAGWLIAYQYFFHFKNLYLQVTESSEATKKSATRLTGFLM